MKMYFTKALGVCFTFFALFLLSATGASAQECSAVPEGIYLCQVDVNSPEYATVIADDPFCCDNSWDGICQGDYDDLGGPINPAAECEPDCPVLGGNIGDSCDDGNPDTFNDAITADCECIGQSGGPGDTCGDPIVVSALPFTDSDNTANYANSVTTMVTTTTYPGISNGTGSASYISGPEAIYEYTAGTGGVLDISLSGTSGWASLLVFKGCPFNERLAYSTSTTGDSRSISQLPVVSGETIYVVVSTWLTQTANTDYVLNIEEFGFDCPDLEANIGDACDDGDPDTIGSTVDNDCDCTGGFVPADNEVCAGALPVECGGSVSGSTVGTLNDDLPSCGTTNGTGGGVWYTYTAPYDGTATYDLCDTDYDSKIRVFSGSCEALECVGGNDDSFANCGAGNASFLVADIEEGVTYYILVHGFSANEGNFTLNLSCEVAPVFDCPEEEANIGDACDDGDPTTEGSTVDANCECTGGTEIVFEGCTTGSPFGSANPDCNSSADVTGAWTDEYASITVASGDDYIFTVSNPDYYVTITDADQNILVFGQETTAWTSSIDGIVRFYSHAGPGCPTTSGSATSHTKTIERVCEIGEFDCPDLEANFGDDCGENGTVSEDCECVEPEPFAGCLDDEGFSPWPSNAITLECGGDSFSQGFAYASEYSLVDVLDGVTYSFSLSNEDYAVTIADEAGAAILTFGPGTGTDFTSDFDGVVRFYSHDPSDCALTGSATSHTRTVSATFDCPAFDCPDLEANIGDDCGENGTVSENCECVEPGPFAGCLDDEGFSPWPSNAITLECGGDSFEQTGSWTSEYSLVNVIDGVTYSFSLSNEDYAVTIADEAGAAILTFGPGTGTDFTSDFDGVVRFYSHDPSDCALSGGETSHARSVSATYECPAFDCPDLEANFGDDCGENGTVSEDCECVEPEPIANADCADALPIACGGAVSGSTIGASNDSLPFCGTGNGTGGGVWYTYTAPYDGTATYDLCDTDYDSKIRVFSGSCEALECVGGNDDSFTNCGSGGASFLVADIEEGVTYYILVHGFSANEGNFTLNLSCEEAPVFDCPEEEANIGDACDDGDPTTEGSTVDANCECTGGTEIVFEGCTTGSSFGSANPDCNSSVDVTGAWTNEYASITVASGDDYIFTVSNPDYYVTITDADQNILVFGQATTAWTSSIDGIVRFYSHAGPGCPTTSGGATSHTKTIERVCEIIEFDCPDLEANIGDDCGENGTVSEDCECVEPEPFAGCLDDEGGFSPYPSDNIVLECGGDSFSQSFAYASEYSLVDVLDGVTYSFSLSNEDYAVTIADEAGAAILTFGPGTGVDFTSDFDGVVRFYSHDPSDCALTGNATSHTRTVSATFDCPPAFDCPDLEANIGDDCELADGSNGAVDDDCNCVCASAGGTMSFNGNTNRVCAGTADAAIFEAALTGASGDNSIWVLTENQFILLDTDADGANFDFDALDEGGIYRVRHISYANGVDINDVLANPTTAGGCWESSNDIRVLPNPETGTISLLNESNEFCPGQGAASFAGLEVTGEDNTVGSRYVLADASGDVIQVRNQANFNLNNVAPGTYTAYRAVWTWISSYVPDPTAGLNVNDIGFCQALSNGIELTVNDCAAQASITSNPNPTPGESWVTFSVDQPQQVQIEVYDMAGRHIKTVFNQNAAGGQEYRMQFDGSGLPNGIYMYRMTTASEVLVDKFMIAR